MYREHGREGHAEMLFGSDSEVLKGQGIEVEMRVGSRDEGWK